MGRPRDWNKYPTQKSVAISLIAGKKYYIEALHREGVGGDILVVGWNLPNTATITVIPGSVLSPFTNSAARLVGEEALIEALSFKAMPNPFSTTTLLEFTAKESEQASLALYDSRGRLIKDLFAG